MRLRSIIFIYGLLVFAVSLQAQDAPMNGQIDDTTPFVVFPVTVGADETLLATMNTTSGDLDAYLLLVDERGNVLAESNDESRENPNPKIELTDLPAANYQLIATRYNIQEGDTSGEFEVSLTLEPKNTDTLDYATFVTPEALLEAGYQENLGRSDIAEWTVLAYYGGDNNLERDIINDIEEFELGGGSNETVNIVALLDRSTEFYADEEGDWSGARVYHLQAATNPTLDNRVDTPQLFDLGQIDTNNGATLAQFLVWGIRNFPAKKYIVAFASHGNGWQGVSQDDAAQEAQKKLIIPLQELDAAFTQADQAIELSGGRAISLVINDACLMGSLEYYSMLADYADYVLASPEIVLSPALNMTLLTETLKANPNLDIADPDQLATPLIDRYFADISKTDQNAYMGYALVDLGVIPSLVADLEELAATVNSNPQAIASLLGKARAAAYTYSAYAGVYTKVDVGDLLRQVTNLTFDPLVLERIQPVQRALSSVVITGKAGETLEQVTSYINVYFPQERGDFDASYYANSPLDAWKALLRSYFNQLIAPVWTGDAVLDFHPPISAAMKIVNTYPAITENVPVSNSQIGFALDVEITGRKLARGQLVVTQNNVQLFSDFVTKAEPTLDGVTYLNDWNSGLSKRYAAWNGRLPQVSDGTTSAFELVRLTPDRQTARMLADITLPNSDTPTRVEIIFGQLDYDSDLEQLVAYAESATDVNGTSNFALPVGTKVTAIRTLMGKGKRTTEEPSTSFVIGEDGLYYTNEIAPDGMYNMVFTMTTFGGQSERVQQEVQVDNSAAQSEMVGYTLFDFGVNVALPVTWSPPSPTQLGFYTSYDMEAYLELVGDSTDEEAIFEAELSTPYMEVSRVEVAGSADGIDVAVAVDMLMQQVDGAIFAGGEPTKQSLLVGETDVFQYGLSFDKETTIYALILRTELDYVVVSSNAEFDESLIKVTPLAITETAEQDTSEWTDFTVSYDRDLGVLPLPKAWTGQLNDHLAGVEFTEQDGDKHRMFDVYVVGGYTQSSAALSDLLSRLNTNPNYSNIVLRSQRPYYGERYSWQVQFVEYTYKGLPYVGRLYVTTTQLGTTYFILFGADAASVDKEFNKTFEIMLDGFQIPETLRVFRDDNTGTTLLYDRAWTFMGESRSEELFGTSSLNNRDQIYGYYGEWEGDAESFAITELLRRSLVRTSDLEAGTLNGREGVFVSYEWYKVGQEVAGFGFASVEDGVGLLIAYETNQLTLSYEQLQAAFNRLITPRFTFTGELPISDSQVGELLLEPIDRPIFEMRVPRAWQGPQLSYEDVNGDEAQDLITRWVSPTGNSSIEFAEIIVFPFQVDEGTTLRDYVTAEATDTTLDGRLAFQDANGFTTFMPERSYVLRLSVTTDDATLKQQLTDVLLGNFQWKDDSRTFNPDDLGQEYAIFLRHEEVNEYYPDYTYEGIYTLTPPDGWYDWEASGQFYSTLSPDVPAVSMWSFIYETRNVSDPITVYNHFFADFPLYQSFGEPQPLPVEGYEGLQFGFIYEQPGGVRTVGYAMLFLLPDDFALVVSAESALVGRYKAELAYACIYASLRFDATYAEPCAWELTTSLSVEGMSFESYEEVPPMSIQDFDGEIVYYTTPEDNAIEYYGYYWLIDPSSEDTLNDAIEAWGLALTAAPQRYTTDAGFEGYILDYETSHFVGGEQYDMIGRGFAIPSGDSLYILSVETYLESDPTLIDAPFELLLKTLRLP